MNWIDKKQEIIDDITFINGKPLFSFIEFNLTNYCNRNCSFCPTVKPDKKEDMTLNTYIKILSELKELGYEGLIGYSGFSEPTLHWDIDNFIIKTKEYLPDCTLVLNSNGDFLTKENMSGLFIGGVDYIILSLYDGEEQYNKFNDMKFENVFINKRYNGDMIKNNRAGALSTKNKVPFNKPCYYPFYMLYLDWDGDILFCCHNYLKKGVLGNIKNDTIISVWNGDKITKMRNNFLQDNRLHSPCNKCDVIGTMMGKKSFEYYKT